MLTLQSTSSANLALKWLNDIYQQGFAGKNPNEIDDEQAKMWHQLFATTLATMLSIKSYSVAQEMLTGILKDATLREFFFKKIDIAEGDSNILVFVLFGMNGAKKLLDQNES